MHFTGTKSKTECQGMSFTLYLIERPFNPFANRADPDQAALRDHTLLCLLMEI